MLEWGWRTRLDRVEASRLREKYITKFIAVVLVARDAIGVAVSY